MTDCRGDAERHPSGEQNTPKGPEKRWQGRVRIGHSDPSVTGNAGMVAVTIDMDTTDVEVYGRQ
ncbi:MAG: hypothetical protein WBO08_00600 [Mycobacterium sp.]